AMLFSTTTVTTVATQLASTLTPMPLLLLLPSMFTPLLAIPLAVPSTTTSRMPALFRT
ncbi:hypothetical protein LPJ56_005983, partial [Coemansia sp. RSA 2599]